MANGVPLYLHPLLIYVEPYWNVPLTDTIDFIFVWIVVLQKWELKHQNIAKSKTSSIKLLLILSNDFSKTRQTNKPGCLLVVKYSIKSYQLNIIPKISPSDKTVLIVDDSQTFLILFAQLILSPRYHPQIKPDHERVLDMDISSWPDCFNCGW